MPGGCLRSGRTPVQLRTAGRASWCTEGLGQGSRRTTGFPSALPRYNWHITLYKFKVIWYFLEILPHPSRHTHNYHFVSQTEKDKSCMISLPVESRKSELMDTKSRKAITRAWGWEEGETVVSRVQTSPWKMIKFWGLNAQLFSKEHSPSVWGIISGVASEQDNHCHLLMAFSKETDKCRPTRSYRLRGTGMGGTFSEQHPSPPRNWRRAKEETEPSGHPTLMGCISLHYHV